MNSTICGEIEELATKQLIDNRDQKSYWVAKLRDGNCWMTQNLALDLYGANITKNNSDITASTWTEAKTIQSELWSDTTTNVIKWYASLINQDVGHISYGNYYTWQAATAGTGSTVTTYPGNASGSICPKNWKLPTQAQYAQLVGGLNGEIQAVPYYFVTGGYVNAGGKLNDAGSNGSYWSSTAKDATLVYNFSFSSSIVNPSANSVRYVGYSVRCLVLGS